MHYDSKQQFYDSFNNWPTGLRVYAWSVIMIMILLVWPIGLFLMIKKLITEKNLLEKNSMVVSTVGCMFLVAGTAYVWALVGGLLGPIGSYSSTISVLIALAVSFAIGVPIILVAKWMRLRGAMYHLYVEHISGKDQVSLDDLAKELKTQVSQVECDLPKMLKCGFFAGRHIDMEKRALVWTAKDTLKHTPADTPDPSAHIFG